MKHSILSLVLLFLLNIHSGFCQDLDELVNDLAPEGPQEYVMGTFKGTTIINGQSVEIAGNRDINFKISHRFGQINQGIYNFFGIDQASSRFGFEYGIADILSLSIGRNSFEKTYDGGIKVRILRQEVTKSGVPVSMSFYTSVFVKTLKWDFPERDNLFSSRLSYNTQLLVARKFNQRLSLQISPTFIHKNLVPTPEDQNNIFAAGLGGRYKITRKISINAEYFYLLPGKTADDFVNSLSLGFDVETGGHVFQLQLTNSRAMFERGFITENTGGWGDGDIFLGFNLYRVFTASEKQKNIY